MTTFTKNEQAAFNEIAAISMDGGVADIKDVARATGLSTQQSKGVLSSLVKKDKIECVINDANGQRHDEIWPDHPTINDANGSFWCDVLSDDEYKAGLITDDQVK